jgi:hypothetical protein
MTTVLAAAANNAHWCDAVVAAHGGATLTDHWLWIAQGPVPPLYPGIVTLRPGAQAAVTAALVVRDAVIAIKDSFADLDLSPFGFEPVIEGEWLAAAPGGPDHSEFTVVTDAAGLSAWNAAWRAGESLPDGFVMFPDTLIPHGDVRFAVWGPANGPLAGGILNRAAGVVGLSNLFSAAPPGPELRRGLTGLARSTWPGLPIVMWDSGTAVATARDAGFHRLGPLRVWVRR